MIVSCTFSAFLQCVWDSCFQNMSSASGTPSPPPGLSPWIPLGDFHPPDPLVPSPSIISKPVTVRLLLLLLLLRCLSEVLQLLFGVPQPRGSVLGRLLFLLFVSELFDTVSEFGFTMQLGVCRRYTTVYQCTSCLVPGSNRTLRRLP